MSQNYPSTAYARPAYDRTTAGSAHQWSELQGISDGSQKCYAYYNNTPDSAIAALCSLDKYVTGTKGTFNGILAFSQGAGLAIMYLLYWRHLYPDQPFPVQFLVLFSPIGVYSPEAWLERRILEKVTRSPNPLPLPTAIFWGIEDYEEVKHDVENSKQIFVKEKGYWNYQHSGTHEVPTGTMGEDMPNIIRVSNRAISEARMYESLC